MIEMDRGGVDCTVLERREKKEKIFRRKGVSNLATSWSVMENEGEGRGEHSDEGIL